MARAFLGDVNLTNQLLLNGSAGTSGQVLTSGGPSGDPIWSTISSGSGSFYVTGPTAPSGAASGDHWLDTETGVLFIYFNDGNSNQWVDTSQSGYIGPTGPTGPTGSVALNALTIKSDSGTTEGTDLYTFTGASAKSINLVSGTAISIAETSGTLTFNNSGVTALSGTTDQITVSGSTGSVTLSLPSAVTISGAMTAGSFVTSGGTSTQFLKADGSVDSSTYLTSSTGVTTVNGSSGAITNVLTSSATGVQTFLTTPSSANLVAMVTDETGTGNLMFSINPTLSQVSTSVEGGQLNWAPSNEVGSTTWFIDSWWNGTSTQLRVGNGSTVIASFDPAGTLSVPTGSILPMAGTTTEAPIDFAPGTNLTTPTQGAMEFDGNTLFITGDTTNGSKRQIVPAVQYYYLATGASAIAANTSFFPTARPAMLSGHMYHFKYFLHFTKNTAGTVTFQLKNSAAANFTYINARATIIPSVGVLAAVGNMINVYAAGAATATFTASQSLTAANHLAIVEGYCVPAANTRLDIAPSAYGAGTITTLVSSNYIITDLGTSTATQGNFG